MTESVNYVFQMVFILLTILKLTRTSYVMVVKSHEIIWCREFALNPPKRCASGINLRPSSCQYFFKQLISEAATQSCSYEKVF